MYCMNQTFHAAAVKKKKAQEEENEYNESDKNEFKKRLKLMEKDAIILKKAKMEKNPELVEMSRKMKLAYKEWKTLLEEQDKQINYLDLIYEKYL